MAEFSMPRITSQESDTSSSDELTKTPRKPFNRVIRLDTLWCLPCLRYAVREWETHLPLRVDCYMLKPSSKACLLCEIYASKCGLLPQGILGHVFELMALIEFVGKYWIDCGDQWQANGDPEEKWPEKFIEQLSDAVKSLCAAFDDLVETHRKSHMLTGNVSDEAQLGYSAWCIARQYTIRPSTHRSDKLHLQYAVRATEHLRLRVGEEGSFDWAMAILSFYQAVKTSVEDYVKTKGAYLTSIHTRYIEQEFPLEAPGF
ncbi:hypothetical protein N7527_009315 [Penicillium freii]|uniref:Uncharacterized protein n=1 Tax=Penicillium freii TaxID=48697 RepID=A0A101MC71_PENFR|nr:hypothetical protein N7527_009315 [Penicillium freii]KUM57874.1 hypothetical protein ACN42_g9296 [Penicillium freii]